jgi:hypothetical protein
MSFNSADMAIAARRSIGKRVFPGSQAPIYSTTSKGLNAVQNSFTPYDLLMNPDYTPTGETLAGVTPYTADPNSVGGAYIVPAEIKDQRLSPKGVAIHEQAHWNDPRINNTNMNLGYNTFDGGPGFKAGQELPAILAERTMRKVRKSHPGKYIK